MHFLLIPLCTIIVVAAQATLTPCDICLNACRSNPSGADPNCLNTCNMNLKCSPTSSTGLQPTSFARRLDPITITITNSRNFVTGTTQSTISRTPPTISRQLVRILSTNVNTNTESTNTITTTTTTTNTKNTNSVTNTSSTTINTSSTITSKTPGATIITSNAYHSFKDKKLLFTILIIFVVIFFF